MEMGSIEKHKVLTYSENACHTCESVQKRNRGVTNFVVLYRVSTKSSEFSGVKLSVEPSFQVVYVSLGLPRPGRRQKRSTVHAEISCLSGASHVFLVGARLG